MRGAGFCAYHQVCFLFQDPPHSEADKRMIVNRKIFGGSEAAARRC
jgi:hypothetical protein